MRYTKKSFLRGGLYHIGLIFVAGASFNWGFRQLTGVDIAGRVFSGISIPPLFVAMILCVSAVIVLWNNWVD